MNKYSGLSSLLAAVTLTLASSSVLAYPITTNVTLTCPAVSAVSNFGGYLAGFGNEDILGQNNPVYFQNILYPAGVPDSIVNYSNSSTNYDSANGYVYCSYTSSNAAENPFDLAYYVTNGKGGRIQSQSNNSIVISFLIGLRS